MSLRSYLHRRLAQLWRGLKSAYRGLRLVTTVAAEIIRGTAFIYIYRGLKYASTSAAAIFAGYLMQAEHVTTSDLWLLSIPVAAAWFFFICYANRFDLDRAEEEHPREIQHINEKNAVLFFLILLIALSAIALSRSVAPTRQLLLSLGTYSALLVFYGIFLLRYQNNRPLPLIRHQLVWPVMLSIGIGLYSGLSFSVLTNSYIPLLPAAVIVFFIVISLFNLGRNSFLWVMLTAILIITIFLVLNLFGIVLFASQNPFAKYLAVMFFCIAASAYLAVFEAWKITAYVASIEATLRDHGPTAFSKSESSFKHDNFVPKARNMVDKNRSPNALHLRKSSEYALGTLAALTITILVLPLYFVFSDYGNVFLVVFALHALVAFLWWFFWGRTKYLRRRWWWAVKSGFGLAFLGILVLATAKKDPAPVRFLTGFADWHAFIGFSLLTGSTIPGLLIDISKQKGSTARTFLLGLFRERVNFTRLLSLLCVIPLFVTVSLSKSIDAPAPEHYRAELAFYVYVLCILFCLVVEGVYYINRERKRWRIRRIKRAMRTIAGFFLLIRIATSTVIALVIILPSLHEGLSFTKSFLSALPFFLAATGGFALNDYYDAEKDIVNKPYRAIPSGKMSGRAALATAIVLIVGAFVTASLSYGNKLQLVLYYLSILGVCFYNYLVKHFTLSKNVVTSLVSTLPILYVVSFLRYPPAYLLIPAASLMFLIGREWLMDIRDIKGDGLSGIETLPMRIGTGRTALIAFLSLFVSSALLLLLALRIQTRWATTLLCLMTMSIVLLSFLWNFKQGRYRRAVVLGLWLPMDCGILMLLR